MPHPLRLFTRSLVAFLMVLAHSGAEPRAQITRPRDPMPWIKVPPSEKPIELARMEVRVSIAGLESETTTTLAFHNPNLRPLAGDLEFPLPDGSVVAGYALDVSGRMVDGVGVSKEKARVVLETEMRRRVDPGIVEHVRGSLFRTRIFPLPPRGERTVRVVTVAPLTVSGGEAALHVPLPRLTVPELTLQVSIDKGPVRPKLGGFGNLSVREWNDRWVAEASFRQTNPGEDLYVRLPALPSLVVSSEEFEGEHFVSISHAPSLPSAEHAPALRRAAIAWDASGSRTREAVRRDLAVLTALAETPSWRSSVLDVVVFRDRVEPPRTFWLANGRSRELAAFLEALPYDGGTDLSALDLRRSAVPHADLDAWILFTDALFTLGTGMPRVGGLPVHVVASDSSRDAGLQRFLAAATGGQLIDATITTPEEAARLLAAPPVTLLRVDADPAVLTHVQHRFAPGSSRASVYARLMGTGTASLVYGRRGREVLRVPVSLAASAPKTGRVISRAWAARMVEDLAVFPDRNEPAMVDLGRRYGLVTPVTSLIVLETAQQYAEHGIEPPASWPEMQRQYFAVLDARKGRERQRLASKIDRVVGWWEARVAWWEREFHYDDRFKWVGAGRGETDRRQREEIPGGVVGGVVGGVAEGLQESVMAPPAAPTQARGARPMAAVARDAAKAATDSGKPSTAASILVAPWNPDAPYLRAIRAAAPRQVYAAYLDQRSAYADSPAFFLDCAGAILETDKRLGLRVLSNLAELRIDDATLLQVFAWRLSEAGELDRAIETLERVRRLRPEDPQSHRDLALQLADRMDRDRRIADGQRAVRLLYDVVVGEWDRFEGIEVIALMEVNRLVARLERLDAGAARRVDYIDERLRKLLDVDVRITLSWDADNTDVDLHVIEPSGEEAFYGRNQTRTGGLVSRDFTQGYGPEEYVVHRAMPGVYRIRCRYYGSSQQSLVGPATVSAVVITNFGRADERRQTLTLRLDRVRGFADVGEVSIGGTAGGSARR